MTNIETDLLLCTISVCLFLVEIATLTRKDNATLITILKADEVNKMIKKHVDEEKKAEAEKKKEGK